MKLGDTITIQGVEFKARAFTAAEHQAFDELADAHQLDRKAAEAQALATTRAGTAREALLRSESKRLQAELKALLAEDGGPRPDLTEEERLQAFELAATIDDHAARMADLQEERTVEALLREEELMQAREAVIIQFAYQVLAPPVPIEEFAAGLTPEELTQLDDVVTLGKLRTGLSASNRRQAVMLGQQLSLIEKLAAKQGKGGNASASRPQPPAARAKRGQTGRSRKSSSTSKAGA